jgi:hypothetical protein
MEKELLIQRGSTFEYEVLWAHATDFTYKAITAISLAFGPPRLTVTGHGVPPGWPVAITRVAGMRQINAANSPPSGKDYHTVKVIDANTLELNDVDATGFSAYTSGGFIQFKTPIDFAGYTFRQDIKDKIGGTVLASSELADAPKNIITITPTPTESKLLISIAEPDTAAIAWSKGVTDLEAVSPLGKVVKLKLTSSGDETDPDPVRVVGEVTT